MKGWKLVADSRMIATAKQAQIATSFGQLIERVKSQVLTAPDDKCRESQRTKMVGGVDLTRNQAG